MIPFPLTRKSSRGRRPLSPVNVSGLLCRLQVKIENIHLFKILIRKKHGTSLKTGFAQIFYCCPKNLSCPKFVYWMYKLIIVCLIHLKVVQECYWIANSVIKMVTNQCLHFNVCQDGVNDFDVGVNESIFFSFVCRMTHMNAQKCYWMLTEMQKS